LGDIIIHPVGAGFEDAAFHRKSGHKNVYLEISDGQQRGKAERREGRMACWEFYSLLTLLVHRPSVVELECLTLTCKNYGLEMQGMLLVEDPK
jgi:hypothetical protein